MAFNLTRAAGILDVPLIVVLGHDGCGAVKATLDDLDENAVPDGFIRSVVERVAPSILMGRNEGLSTVDELEVRHVVETGSLIMQRSRIIADKVNKGACAIVGVTYALSDGRMRLQGTVGDVGETATGCESPVTPIASPDTTAPERRETIGWAAGDFCRDPANAARPARRRGAVHRRIAA